MQGGISFMTPRSPIGPLSSLPEQPPRMKRPLGWISLVPPIVRALADV